MNMIGKDCEDLIYDYVKQLNYSDLIDSLKYRKRYDLVLREMRLYFHNRHFYAAMRRIHDDIVIIDYCNPRVM